MVTLNVSAIIFATISFAVGFLAGRYLGKGGNQQNVVRFADLDKDEADEIREKGRQTVAARIEKRKARILERAKREGKIANDDVEDLFCISDTTARNYLNELEAEGKLTQVGESGRGVYYTPHKGG